jgi:hypothetical protein
MAEQPPPRGTLYIAKEVLQFDKWMQDQVISAAMQQMNKYKYFDGFLKPSTVRHGDFSLLLADARLIPIIATFIGIPGRSRSPIIQELYVKT